MISFFIIIFCVLLWCVHACTNVCLSIYIIMHNEKWKQSCTYSTIIIPQSLLSSILSIGPSLMNKLSHYHVKPQWLHAVYWSVIFMMQFDWLDFSNQFFGQVKNVLANYQYLMWTVGPFYLSQTSGALPCCQARVGHRYNCWEL